MTTARDIVTNALLEMGAIAQFETPEASDINFGLSKLNRMINAWNASKLFIYAVNFQQYQLIAGKNPQTVGKGFAVSSVAITSNVATVVGVPSRPFFNQGDRITSLNIPAPLAQFNVTAVILQSVSADGTTITFALVSADVPTTTTTGVVIPANQPATEAPDFPIPTNRPAKILNANIILNQGAGQSIVRCPMRIVDADWWANQRVPQVQTNLPTHFYPQFSYPNLEMFFWPVPSVSVPVELETWTNLNQLSLNDSFILPQGYEDAITYSLAEALCPSYGRPLDPTLSTLALRARGLIQSLNSASPKIVTADYGVPGSSRDRIGKSDFNWISGNLSG